MRSRRAFWGALLPLAFLLAPAAQAGTIESSDILAIPSGVTGSGNGTLDLRLVTFSGSDVDNSAAVSGQCAATFPGELDRCDYDNANTEASQGGGTPSFAESYVTTAGDLQDFYELNFGATTTGEIELVLFLDLNETGVTGEATNTLDLLDIILNPATIQGDPDPSGDVTSDEQAFIDQVFTGGTTIAELDPEPADNLPVNSQGAGFADYAISTGIDPFALAASDVLLFNFSMDLLNNGAEEIFLSGTYSGTDVGLILSPEPSTALLLASGLVAMALGRRRRL